MTDKENTYVGIDMSGSQTRCLVAASEGSVLRYVSCGSMPPARWNADDQREQQLTQESVLEAVCEAENEGGLTVLSAVVGVGGAQVHSYLVHSSVAVPRGRQTVQAADVAKVVRKAANGATSPGSTVLQVVPMEFVAGARAGLSNPVGYPAHRLEAYVRVIFTPQAEHDHANWLVNQASVRVDETLVPGFASAYGTLVEAERARGVAHLDIGKTSSSLTAYRGGLLRLASGLPIGRDHLMNDVSRAFGTDPRVATSLISDFGSAVYRDEFSRVYVFVPSEGPSRRTEPGSRVGARHARQDHRPAHRGVHDARAGRAQARGAGRRGRALPGGHRRHCGPAWSPRDGTDSARVAHTDRRALPSGRAAGGTSQSGLGLCGGTGALRAPPRPAVRTGI